MKQIQGNALKLINGGQQDTNLHPGPVPDGWTLQEWITHMSGLHLLTETLKGLSADNARSKDRSPQRRPS